MEHDRELNLAPRPIPRRNLLKLLAGAGVVTLAGCASSKHSASTGAASATTTTGASGTTSSANCARIPTETAGPFPGDGSNGPNALTEAGIIRRDITSSFGSASGTAEGVPAKVEITLLDSAGGCVPMVGAGVYLWHCDREGRYSLYSDGVENENYLRGVQESDAEGVVTFDTIFPACYSGRWPHIHFAVYPSLLEGTSAGMTVATSQIALPVDVCNTVFATDGYEQSVQNVSQISLQSDSVFGDDGGVHELATVTGSIDEGYVIALPVGV